MLQDYHWRLLLLPLLLLLLPPSVLAIQLCTNADHIACIQANGNGWGCDTFGDQGSCCEGECGDPDCATWECKQIASVGPGGGLEKLEKALEDFVGAIGHTVGGGTGSGMDGMWGVTMAVPSFVADLAWADLVKAFRSYVLGLLSDGKGIAGGKIIRIGAIEIVEPKRSGASGGTKECLSAVRDQSRVFGSRSQDSPPATQIIEFMRPMSDPTTLSAVVVMHIAEDCTLLREDYYAYGIYGWSSNRGGARLRPLPQED